MTPDPIGRRSLSLRATLLVMTAAVALYVTGMTGYMAVRLGPGLATLEAETSALGRSIRVLRDVMRVRDSALTEARAMFEQDPVATGRALSARVGQLPDAVALGVVTDLASVPAEMRRALGAAADAESVVAGQLEEVAAHLMLGEVIVGRAELDRADSAMSALARHVGSAQESGVMAMAARQRDLSQIVDLVRRATMVWVLVGITLVPLGWWILQRRLYGPLGALDAGFAELAEGRQGVAVPVTRADEMGRLAQHFNEMAAALDRQVQSASAELRDTVEAQRKIETYFRTLIGEVSDLLLVIDERGVVSFASPSHERVLKRPPSGLLGQTIFDLFHPDDRPHLEGRLAACAENDGDVVTFVARASHAWGEWKTLDIVARNLPNDPAVSGMLVIARDITELVEREGQLRQAQKMEAVGQLTGGMVHDFNNLLFVVLGNLELLQAHLNSDHQRRLAERALQATTRGASLTQQLLAFSRRQMPQPQPVDLTELTLTIADLLLRRTLGSAIEVKAVSTAGLWSCLVDPIQVETLLLNLALNARDAMPDGGTLTITTENRSESAGSAGSAEGPGQTEFVALQVRDTGTGMSADVLERIYEPFFTTKEAGKGSGLGLSMVHGFVKQSDGLIDITSEEGVGTLVEILFPRHCASGPVEDIPPLAPSERRGSGEIMLVVEGDPDVRGIVVATLGELGYRTLEAVDGATALRVLEQNGKVELLLTELVLPGGMHGVELATRAREMRQGLNVLYMSDAGYDLSRVRGISVDLVLNKPFHTSALADRVYAVLTG